MKHASRVLLTTFLFGLALLIGGSDAEAGKRIAVLDIEGSRDDGLRDEVAKLVDRRHEVISGDSYRKAARRAKAKRMRPKDVRKVASMLAVDGVLEGMLVAEDNGYVLRLRLREGATGKTVRKFTVFLKTPSMSRKISKQLSKRLMAAIGNLERMSSEGDGDDWSEEDEERDLRAERRAERKRKAEERKQKAEERKQKAEERKRMRAERKRKAREEREERRRARDFIDDSDMEAARGDEDEDEDWDEDEGDDDDEDWDEDEGDDADDAGAADRDSDSARDDRGSTRRGAPDPRTAAITLNAGATVIGRSLRFNARPDLAMPPSQYNGAFAPGATMSGELFPMAFGDEDGKSKSKTANLGFGFDVERSIGLSSAIQTAEGMEPIKLTTQRQRYGIRALYRHNFGDKASHPTAILSVGWSKMSFTIDKSQVPEGIVVDVPDVVYRYIDPGLKLRFPAGEKIAVITEAKFMAITGAGPIVAADQYGQATVLGVDGDVALEYRAAPKWLVRVGGHVNYIGYTFKAGAGELSSNRDGNLADLDVGGAADMYMGGYVTAGYLY